MAFLLGFAFFVSGFFVVKVRNFVLFNRGARFYTGSIDERE
ncbi:hypothetical protein VFA_002331 [Vibrio furnissii CIP 102972]|nr:hypothetical protein VFA_002331 [Vibrio furnissii CIP 102972]